MNHTKTLTALTLCATLLLSGCNTDNPAETSAVTEEVTTTTEVTTTAETTATTTTAAVTTAKPEAAVLPVLSINLNNDGIDEEIYIDDDRYRVVYNSDAGEYMYDTITTVGRPDKLYIYKCDDGSYFYLYDANDDAGFAQHNFVVTDHGLNKYVYSRVGCQTGNLLRYSDTFHDKSIDRAGFNSVFFAPREQIAESISAEYLGILDIDALVNIPLSELVNESDEISFLNKREKELLEYFRLLSNDKADGLLYFLKTLV